MEIEGSINNWLAVLGLAPSHVIILAEARRKYTDRFYISQSRHVSYRFNVLNRRILSVLCAGLISSGDGLITYVSGTVNLHEILLYGITNI